MQLFVNILRCRSLRRAAAETSMTEPTLNHKLRTLENELGVTLLARTPRGITLTPEGEVFAALAPRLLGTWQDIRKAMSPMDTQNEVWIAATPDLASLILPRFFAHLGETFQKSAAGVIVCHPPELLQGLESGRFNVGLLHSVGNLPNLLSRRLFEDRLTLISGEQLPELSIDVIKGWEIFAPVKDYLAWNLIESFFEANGVWPRRIVHINHPLLITQIVKHHSGLRGIVADGMLSNLTAKELQSPFPVKIRDALLPTLPTYAVWRKDERSRSVTEFVDLLIRFVATRRRNPSSVNSQGNQLDY